MDHLSKAVRDGKQFDIWSSAVVIIGNAVPSFLFAILLIIIFAGGRYLDLFPLRGVVSDNWTELSNFQKIVLVSKKIKKFRKIGLKNIFGKMFLC